MTKLISVLTNVMTKLISVLTNVMTKLICVLPNVMTKLISVWLWLYPDELSYLSNLSSDFPSYSLIFYDTP